MIIGVYLAGRSATFYMVEYRWFVFEYTYHVQQIIVLKSTPTTVHVGVFMYGGCLYHLVTCALQM